MSAVCVRIEYRKRNVLIDTLSAERRFECKMCHVVFVLKEFSDDSNNNTDNRERVSEHDRRDHQCADF
jgi:hypothetical protein